MKIIFLFLFLILAACTLPQLASAVTDTLSLSNCDALGFVPALCGTLRQYSQKAGWTAEEEKGFLYKIFAEGGIMPNHDFVKQWNMNLPYDRTAPENGHVEAKSCPFRPDPDEDGDRPEPEDCITFGWSRTFAVLPSLYGDDTFYIPPEGEVFAAYYYELSDPNNDGGGCATLYSDDDETLSDNDDDYGNCKTRFDHEDNSTIDIKMKGISLFESPQKTSENGGIHLAPYITTDLSPKFSSTLTIKNRVTMEQYGWERDDDYDREGCKRYCCKDQPSVTQRDVTVTITHDFKGNVQVFEKTPVSHSMVAQNVDSTPEVTINTNAEEYKLFMNNAMLQKAGAEYSFESFYFPYNILAVTREPASNTTYLEKDMYVTEAEDNSATFETYPYNMDEDDCSFVVLWPFPGYHEPFECNLFKKATTSIGLETEKRHHEPDEDVELTIDFDAGGASDSVDIKLTYGSYTGHVNVNGRKTVSLPPQEGYYSIYAEFAGDDERSPAEALPIPAYASHDNFATYLAVAAIFFVVYGIGYFIRRYTP
jgi:hypothetical protein